MVCPRCKNIKFEPTADCNSPLKVLGKESFPNLNLRRIICLQCGYYFETKEEVNRELEVRGLKIMELVENYQEELNKHKKITQRARLNKTLFEKD